MFWNSVRFRKPYDHKKKNKKVTKQQIKSKNEANFEKDNKDSIRKHGRKRPFKIQNICYAFPNSVSEKAMIRRKSIKKSQNGK